MVLGTLVFPDEYQGKSLKLCESIQVVFLLHLHIDFIVLLVLDYDDHGYQVPPLVKICVLCGCVCVWVGVTLLAGTVASGSAPKPNLFLAAT